MSKFDSPRDELLYAMSIQGWANKTGGDVESPTGFYALISIASNEIAEIRDAFPDESEGVTDTDICGNFLCVEDSNGFWYVAKYPAGWLAEREFNRRENEYSEWDSE